MSLRQKLVNFGGRIIGKARAEAQQQHVASGAVKFGPRVLGDRPPIKGTNIPDPNAKPLKNSIRMSMQELRETLSRNPHYLARFIDVELGRVDGPRREALKLFLEKMPPQSETFTETQREKLVGRLMKALTSGRGEASIPVEGKKKGQRQKVELQEAELQDEDEGELTPAGDNAADDFPPDD